MMFKGRNSIKSIILAILFLGLILGCWIVVIFFQNNSQEPSYNGKSLSYYLNDLKLYGAVNESPRKDTQDALLMIGTNMIPFLRERLVSKDKIFQPLYMVLDNRFPNPDAPRASATPSWVLKKQALRAVPTMGPEASPLIPELLSLLDDSELRYEAAWCLGAIGAKSIQPLVNILEDEHPNAKVRAASMYALIQLKHKRSFKKAKKALASGLNDSSDEVVKQTLIAIRGTELVGEVNKIVEDLQKHENPAIRREAEKTIERFNESRQVP